MTPEPRRLQYLEAMGLTAWVARYRLPNARPTAVCEWPSTEPQADPRPPSDRLHALLDSAAEEAPPRPAQEGPSARERPPHPARSGKARALLGDEVEPAAPDPAPVEATPAEALRFTLQVACLDGRWLLLLPADDPPGAVSRRLLGNLLRAAGVVPEREPSFETFHWPPMATMPVEAPLEEARQGLQAFLEGRRRRGWVPERLLVFGHDATLARVLDLDEECCPPLALPAWQGPALDELAVSADAKRALWPRLAGWREAWAVASAHEQADDDVPAPPDA